MLRKLLVGATSAAMLLGGASVAVAAEKADPTCDEAKASLTKLEKKLDTAVFEERKVEQPILDAAKTKFEAARAAVKARQAEIAQLPKDDPKLPDLRGKLEIEKKDQDAAKSELDAAQKKYDNDSQKLAGLRAQVELAKQDKAEACGDDKPSETPKPTPKPEDDIDCDEVSGPEAQRILDADRNDPNNLDIDNDGIACDVDEVPVPADPAPADPGVVVNNNVAVPSGGVATGGGPAWAFE